MSEAIAIDRDGHTVVAAGEDVIRLQFEVDTGLYGSIDFSTPVNDSLLGDMGPPYSINWSVGVRRESPHRDDEYPLSMPATITNLGFRGDPEDGINAPRAEEVDVIYMSHLFVQEEARRRGYAQLMWDIYLAVVAYGGYRAAGGVGSTEGGGTYHFLRKQGVPEADFRLDTTAPSAHSGVVKWSTDASNVTSTAPIRETTVEVDG